VNLLLEEVHSDLTLKFAHPQDRQALGVKLNDIAALGEALFYSGKGYDHFGGGPPKKA
jgi:hypothetical protein